MIRRLLLLLICLAVAGPAAAQTCIGAAPIDRASHVNMGTTLGFNNAVTSTAFDVRGGGETSFGGVSVALNHYGDIPANSGAVGGVLGSQVYADSAHRIAICPVGQFSYEFGPKNVFDSGVDLSTFTGLGGVSFSAAAADTATVQVSPFAGVLVGSQITHAANGTTTLNTSDTFGIVGVGVAIVLKGRTTISPEVLIPFLVDGGGLTSFQLVVSFPLGHR